MSPFPQVTNSVTPGSPVVMLAAAAFVTTNLAVLAMRGTMLGTKRATRALHMPLQLGSAGFIVKGLLDHPFNPHAAYLADGVPGCVYSLLGYYLFFFPVAAAGSALILGPWAKDKTVDEWGRHHANSGWWFAMVLIAEVLLGTYMDVRDLAAFVSVLVPALVCVWFGYIGGAAIAEDEYGGDGRGRVGGRFAPDKRHST